MQIHACMGGGGVRFIGMELTTLVFQGLVDFLYVYSYFFVFLSTFCVFLLYFLVIIDYY